jgi:hypothetical protein
MAEQTGETGGTYYARVEPLADSGWEVSVWSSDPFWAKSAGRFPRGVAERLGLPLDAVTRKVRTERRARRVAKKVVALCEKRHAAKYDRESFTVTQEPTS